MDYLRTLGSAAVSSLVQKSGLNLPFSLGAENAGFRDRSIWTLYEGTKRDDGSPVSIFEFTANTPAKRNLLPLAKNALRKLRTIRHPDVLKFLDGVETDTSIHIMTERVRPLCTALEEASNKNAQELEDWILWGLHRISIALTFINESCASTHGNVCTNSVFLSPSGEWKLGGFEVLSNPKDDAAVLYTMGSLIPDANKHSSPEVKKGGWSVLKEHNLSALDSYSLGLLIHFAFNRTDTLPSTALPPHPPPAASSRGSIPLPVFSAYKRLLNPNPKARLTPKHFLEIGMAETAGEGSGFFANNRLVKVCAGLDNFNIAGEADKNNLLKVLKESASSLPPEFASFRVLPALASALEFGGASAAQLLPLVLQLGKNVAPQDYSSVIMVHLVKLFASPDRGTRMALLDHLSEFADKLDKKTVTEKIWPNLQTGFTDTVAIIREATVKAIILISDKLSDRILNNDLLRHLAKMQADLEPSIRTNTCILLGRLGPTLGYHTKKKVLVPAFTRALKDPFVHCRVAGLMALMATIDCFETEELATRVIPNMAFTLVDKEKLVRDQAFKCMQLFVKKLEDHAATMPETAEPEGEVFPIGGLQAVNTPGGTNTLVNSAAGAATALAGWAMSSLGKKLATADLQSTMSAVPQAAAADIDRTTSAPPTETASSTMSRPSPYPTFATSLSTPGQTSSTRSTTSGSKGKGMQLGAGKLATAPHLAAEWAEEAAAEAEAEEEAMHHNPWGNDDLMDVNADQDDWSAFETAPSPAHAPAPAHVPVIGLGFNGAATHPKSPSSSNRDSDDWGSMAPLRKSSTAPIRSSTPSESTSAQSRGASPAPVQHHPTMTKEEKAAEMARRKEERKQRIAALKEQKKNASLKT